MSQIVEQVLAASGGLNYDDDPRMFQKGDTTYRLNVIPSSLGDTYVLTNMKGTTTKTHAFSHAGAYAGATYTTIGSCYDIQRNSIYYFVYSDLTNHCIIRYNIDDDDFDKIAWDNPNLGFDTDYPINDAFMIDDWLYWNPRSSSPRAINVEWGYYNELSTVTSVVETDPATNWSVGDLCEFRSKVYRALSAVDTGTVPVTNPEYYQFVSWSYADNNFSARDRYYFNTPMQPMEAPGIEFLNDTGVNTNSVWGKVFQFTYRYYVPQLGVSSAAPFSEVAADFYGEEFNGEIAGYINRSNKIRITVPLTILEDDSTGRADWLFSKVEILFREGKDSVWQVARTLNHDEVYTISNASGNDEYFYIDFFNDGAYEVVDSAEIEKPYNFLPITAKSECAIDGERVGYGGVTEGFDDIPLEVTASSGVRELYIAPNESQSVVDSYTFAFNSAQNVYDEYGRLVEFAYDSGTVSTSGVGTGDYIVVTINGIEYNGLVTTVASDTAYATNIANVINQSPFYAEVVAGPIIRVWAYYGGPGADVSVSVYDVATTTHDVYKIGDFKRGDHHQLCLYYWDHLGRRSEPQYNEDIRVYVPLLSEYWKPITAVADLGGSPNEVRFTSTAHGFVAGDTVMIDGTTNYDNTSETLYTITNVNDANTFDIESAYTGETPPAAAAATKIVSTNYKSYIDWSISHEPPSDAVQWGFGYAGRSSTDTFVQYNIYSAAAGTGVYADYAGLNIKGLQEITTNDSGNLDIALPNSLLESYSFVEGDRVRILTMPQSGADAYNELANDNWTEYERDYEIKAFDPTTHTVYIQPEITVGTWVSTWNDNSVIIEIYRPKKETQQKVFYEMGRRFAIYTSSGNKYHRGQTQDQANYTGGTPATGRMEFGDCYTITRASTVTPGAFSDDEMFFVQSDSWSDYYESDMWSKGKIGAYTGIGRVDLNNVRYGNKFNPKTGTSGVGTFDGLDYLPLSYNYGDITAIKQIGDVLKVLFENNVASVLVNKTQFYNADNTSQIVKSDNVLGSINYSEEAWGCVSPESVLVVDRNLYFFDLRRKAYVRNAPNGSFPISDYKMKKYFIDKSNALITSGISYVKVRSAWDDEHGILHVGFEDTNTVANCEVVMFHEPSNRWVGFNELLYSNTLPVMTTTPSKILSLIGEAVHIVNDSSTYCNFYGTQQTYTVRIYGGLEAPNIIKTFDSIALHTNKYFDITDVQIPATLNYPNGMTSIVPEARFEKQEGVLRSNYLCNQKTTSASATIKDLFNGDTLRGYIIYNDLDGDETVEHTLYKVDIYMTQSKF